MNDNLVIGIDIGGSHITAACIDIQTRKLISESVVRKHVRSKGSVQEILEDWTEAITNCKASLPNVSNKIGIAMPGPFDYENGISYIKDLDKYDSLYNLNVKDLLAGELGIEALDIKMMNDANCFLKGEIFNGTAGDYKNVLGITLGTGLGSALWINSQIQDGDMYQFPFKESTAEEYLSSRWFVKEYQKLTGEDINNVKEIRDKISSNPDVLTLFNEFGKNLGKVLAHYIKKYSIDIVIIGGNLNNAWELFMSDTEKILENEGVKIPIVKSKLGETAALIGGGSLCN